MARAALVKEPAREAAGAAKAPEKLAGGVLSLRRGLQLLELLGEGDGPWSLADLSRRLAVNKAIVLRLLDEMRLAAFVYRDEDTGAYQLTYKLSNLGLRKLSQTGVLDQSNGVLRELADNTGELVRLAVVEPQDRLTWVLAFTGERRSLHIDPNYRLEIGLSTHAVGKAWLSTMAPEKAWTLLHREGIRKMTSHSRIEPAQIEGDLKRARTRGYATSNEENELGVRAIAAPVVVVLASGEKACVGVVSVAAPTSRMSKAEIEGLAQSLLTAVAKISAIWPIQRRVVTVLSSIG